MKILITGVAGFIGSHISRKFISNGHEVFGIDDLSQGKIDNVSEKINFLQFDLSNHDFMKHLPKHCDYVLHIAGQSSGEISFEDPVSDLKKNTISTINLIKYALAIKVKKFLYASSMSVYGDVKNNPVDENDLVIPISCYGISKVCSEKYLEIFKNDLPYLNFRMFNVYGPGQDLDNLKQGMVSIYLSQAIRNDRIQIKGSLDRYRDFIYIDDIVDIWYNLTFNENCKNLNINLGSGVKTSVKELVEKIKNLNPNISYFTEGKTPGDQKGIYSDNRLLSKYFDISKLTSLEDGLNKFHEWAIKKN